MLEDLKSEIIVTAQEAQRTGLMRHRSGNVSALDKEKGLIVITPSGIDREALQIRDISVVRLEDLALIEGEKPSSETLMHAACYRVREDIRAIVHTHSPVATAFAVCERPVPAIVYEMFLFHTADGCIPVAPFARPGTKELADAVAGVIKENDLALMARHGAIAVGKSAEEALLAAHYIEEFATIYMHALQISQGKEPAAFTRDELDAWEYPEEILPHRK